MTFLSGGIGLRHRCSSARNDCDGTDGDSAVSPCNAVSEAPFNQFGTCLRVLPGRAGIFQLVCRFVQIIIFHQLDHAAVAQCRQLPVERDTSQQGIPELLGDLLNVAFAEDVALSAAVGTDGVAHVFDQPQNGNLHHLCHVRRLFHDHGDQILRG